MPVQTITAEKAANLLKKNTRNRKLNKRAVSRYANLMKQGLWRIGNDAICIAPDGTLLNGQHRLNAVVEADVELQMLIREDVDPEDIKAMDQGNKRIGADIATLTGHKMTRKRQSQLRYIGTPWEQSVLIATPGPDVLIALDNLHGPSLDLATEVLPNKIIMPLPVAASAAALSHFEGGEATEKIADFWSIYFKNTPATDRLLDTKHADFVPCQGYMQYQQMLRDNKRLKTFQQYKVCCTMLNAYVRGEQLVAKNRMTFADALGTVPSLVSVFEVGSR